MFFHCIFMMCLRATAGWLLQPIHGALSTCNCIRQTRIPTNLLFLHNLSLGASSYPCSRVGRLLSVVKYREIFSRFFRCQKIKRHKIVDFLLSPLKWNKNELQWVEVVNKWWKKKKKKKRWSIFYSKQLASHNTDSRNYMLQQLRAELFL